MNFPFVQILTLIFVVLKLTGYIDWSWWLVFSPMIALTVLVFIAAICKEIRK